MREKTLPILNPRTLNVAPPPTQNLSILEPDCKLDHEVLLQVDEDDQQTHPDDLLLSFEPVWDPGKLVRRTADGDESEVSWPPSCFPNLILHALTPELLHPNHNNSFNPDPCPPTGQCSRSPCFAPWTSHLWWFRWQSQPSLTSLPCEMMVIREHLWCWWGVALERWSSGALRVSRLAFLSGLFFGSSPRPWSMFYCSIPLLLFLLSVVPPLFSPPFSVVGSFVACVYFCVFFLFDSLNLNYYLLNPALCDSLLNLNYYLLTLPYDYMTSVRWFHLLCCSSICALHLVFWLVIGSYLSVPCCNPLILFSVIRIWTSEHYFSFSRSNYLFLPFVSLLLHVFCWCHPCDHYLAVESLHPFEEFVPPELPCNDLVCVPLYFSLFMVVICLEILLSGSCSITWNFSILCCKYLVFRYFDEPVEGKLLYNLQQKCFFVYLNSCLNFILTICNNMLFLWSDGICVIYHSRTSNLELLMYCASQVSLDCPPRTYLMTESDVSNHNNETIETGNRRERIYSMNPYPMNKFIWSYNSTNNLYLHYPCLCGYALYNLTSCFASPS